MIDSERMGERIAAARKEMGMTQKTLAEMLHVTDKAISKWERGAGCPDIAMLPTLADSLHVSIAALLTGEDTGADSACEASVRAALASMRAMQEKEGRQRRTRMLCIVLAMSLLALVICIGCDRRINGMLTWSAYPLAAVLFAVACIAPLLLPRGGYPMAALGVFSALLLPFLWFVLWWAGAAASFLPLVLPVALMGLAYLWGMVMLMRNTTGSVVLPGMLTCAMVPVVDNIISWVVSHAAGMPFVPDVHTIGAVLFSGAVLLWYDLTKRRGDAMRRDGA